MTFWSLTNSDFPTNQTFHQFHDLDTELDLHRLWVVSMEHLQRVWHASRERLPLRTPGSVPFLGACTCSDCWDHFPRLYTDLMTYRSWLSPNWEVVMEHLRQVWHASRERLPFRTPGSVPHFGTCWCSNYWDQIPRTCHVFTRLFTSNTPWYFLDFASAGYISGICFSNSGLSMVKIRWHN